MICTNDLTHAVLLALLDPDAEFVEVAAKLGIPLTQLLEIAESPAVTAAIEALEKLSQIRARALLAQSTHVAIAALERIADTSPETPAARETARKAAAQLLRMADKAEASAGASPDSVPLRPAEGVAESARPGEAYAPPNSAPAGPRFHDRQGGERKTIPPSPPPLSASVGDMPPGRNNACHEIHPR